jgi:hypothetical protein
VCVRVDLLVCFSSSFFLFHGLRFTFCFFGSWLYLWYEQVTGYGPYHVSNRTRVKEILKRKKKRGVKESDRGVQGLLVPSWVCMWVCEFE